MQRRAQIAPFDRALSGLQAAPSWKSRDHVPSWKSRDHVRSSGAMLPSPFLLLLKGVICTAFRRTIIRYFFIVRWWSRAPALCRYHGGLLGVLVVAQRNETLTRRPVHLGEILADELEAVGLASAELACTLDVPANRISQIIAGKRSITADTALRLGRYFGSSADLWDEPPEDLRSGPCYQSARQGDQQNSAAPCRTYGHPRLSANGTPCAAVATGAARNRLRRLQ